MANQSYDKVMVGIVSSEREQLESLAQETSVEGFSAGAVREVMQVDDSHFDLTGATEILFQVVAVLSQVKAAVELVDWLVNTLRRMKRGDPSLIVTVGDQRAKISHGDDPEERKMELESLLRIKGGN